MKFTISNWNKEANAILVMWTGIIGSLTAFTPQVLSVLHEAPIPISQAVDEWITWALKVGTLTLPILSIFTKKQKTV